MIPDIIGLKKATEIAITYKTKEIFPFMSFPIASDNFEFFPFFLLSDSEV